MDKKKNLAIALAVGLGAWMLLKGGGGQGSAVLSMIPGGVQAGQAVDNLTGLGGLGDMFSSFGDMMSSVAGIGGNFAQGGNAVLDAAEEVTGLGADAASGLANGVATVTDSVRDIWDSGADALENAGGAIPDVARFTSPLTYGLGALFGIGGTPEDAAGAADNVLGGSEPLRRVRDIVGDTLENAENARRNFVDTLSFWN